VETKKARRFFIVDDRLEQDLAGTIKLFEMIAAKYRKQLVFTVQIRLEAAKNTELLKVMVKAGVRTLCIGYESPIDEELKTMHKGYSSTNMLEWTRIYRTYGFRIHAMFIFGYPLKEGLAGVLTKERVRGFKRFIRKAHFDTIQILHPVPIVGTELRSRLEKQGRIFSREIVPWRYYDGSYVCFRPVGMTLREFQDTPMELMKWFYGPMSFIGVALKTLAFPFDYLMRGWDRWHHHWYRDVVKYGGHLLIGRWKKRQRGNNFLKKLQENL